jgi:signal transduction histidine kinase
MLLEVSGGLASSLDLGVVLQTAIDSTVAVLGLETGAIYLLEDDVIYLGATVPPLPADMPDAFRRMPLAGHAHIARCLEERRPVFVSDTATADFTPEEREVSDARELKSVLYIPITTETEAIGTVIIGTQSRLHEFGEHDTDLCQTLSYQIALAVTNARLFGELRETNRELELHREHLAELVEQRTRELAAANHALDITNEELQCANEELLSANDELSDALNEVARANTELERATRAKSLFLANMSHELRTPLHAVIGIAKLLQQEGAGPLGEEQRTQVGMIGDAGRELLSLIDDVLDLSKIEAGRVDLFAEDVDPTALAREVAESLRLLADEKSLDLIVDADGGVPNISSDRGRIRQILVNLIGNAIKFTSTGCVEVAVSASNDGGVAFAVRDTGCGISGEDLERIFETYEQGSGSRDFGAQGTGLGLTLSRELATLLGGSLSATSKPGAGSCFTLRVPREMPVQPAW